MYVGVYVCCKDVGFEKRIDHAYILNIHPSCSHICKHTCTYLHSYMHTYIHLNIHTYLFTYIHPNMQIYTVSGKRDPYFKKKI